MNLDGKTMNYINISHLAFNSLINIRYNTPVYAAVVMFWSRFNFGFIVKSSYIQFLPLLNNRII